MIVTQFGTKLTEAELTYRKELISESKSVCCPVTRNILTIVDGEIIYVKGKDRYVSTQGIYKLMSIFGEEFIRERIITYD